MSKAHCWNGVGHTSSGHSLNLGLNTSEPVEKMRALQIRKDSKNGHLCLSRGEGVLDCQCLVIIFVSCHS